MNTLAVMPAADLTVGCFKATATGLEIEGTPTLESWRHFGRQLGQLHDAIQLCIGDWILFGEHAYGEMYADARRHWSGILDSDQVRFRRSYLQS